jgi:cystathionine beta-lyase
LPPSEKEETKMAADSGKGTKNYRARTRVVVAGRDPAAQHGFVNMPAFRGSTVVYQTMDDLMHRRGRFSYGTRGTPTTEALESAWSDIAGAAGTVLVPSGLAACALALMSCLKAGDHLLVTDSVYRPTRNFCNTVLARFGVETSYYDPLVGSGITALMKPNTKVVFTEAPGSQTFEVQDIPALSEAAHARGAALIMDNTWATPFFFPPHERGADIAVEAGTKYLGGHSDLLLGLVSANKEYWPRLREAFDAMAICAGPEDVYLALRGLRTMRLRLDEQERAGIEMARFLEKRPEVKKVLHPALPSFEGHAIWKRDFLGASGLFSIVLHPVPQSAIAAMLDGLKLFAMGYSWGGFESLIVPFDCKDYRTATQFDPGGPCLRLQIGLEDTEDLKADLEAGFARMKAAAK